MTDDEAEWPPTDPTDVSDTFDRSVLDGKPVGIPSLLTDEGEGPVVDPDYGGEMLRHGDTVLVEARANTPVERREDVGVVRCLSPSTELPDEAHRFADGLVRFTAAAELAVSAAPRRPSKLVLENARPVGAETVEITCPDCGRTTMVSESEAPRTDGDLLLTEQLCPDCEGEQRDRWDWD